MGLSTDQERMAAGIIATLKTNLFVARQRVEAQRASLSQGVGGFIGFGDSSAGQLQALNAVGTALYSAETTWLARVRSGERDFSWWLDAVEEQRNALAQYADTLDSYGLIASARGIIVSTASDTVDFVKDAVPALDSSMKFVVVGLVAVAVIYGISFLKSFKA